MNTIYYHADDYGITRSQSDIILNCHSNGRLNSVSVIPNSKHLSESMLLLQNKNIRKVVHLNFIEGSCVAAKEKVSMLTDSHGNLSCSFGALLKRSFLPGKSRNVLKAQLKEEILAQIIVVSQTEKKVCIDSHQHLHMIPIVLEAIIDVLKENDYQLIELRIPVDPILPLLTTFSLWKRVRLIDCIKWFVLKCCSLADRKLLKSISFESPCFFGIFFTCRMESDIVRKLFPKYIKYANNKNKKLELMFHPGGIYSEGELLDASQKDLVDFYKSPYRKKEEQTLLEI